MQAVKTSASPYNANTNWDNEEKYLKGLSAGGNAWADDQLKTLYAEKAKYTQPSKPTVPNVNISTPVSDQSALIEDLYKAQLDAAVAEIRGAYDRNIADIEAAKAKIPALYQQQRNRTASDAAVTAQNFNEYAAASGLSSGANAQAQLAMNNQLTSGLSSLSQSEAEAMATLETERAKINADYQNAVARAIAEGNANKARALYEEAMRVDEIMRAEEAAAKSRVVYIPETENTDPGKYYDAILTTASNMNTATDAGRDYLTTYLATQKAKGNITDYGVQALLAALGL